MSLAYGPPALLGLVVRRTPRWSGLVSFVVGLVLGSYVTFLAKAGLVVDASSSWFPPRSLAFFLSRFFETDDAAHGARRAGLLHASRHAGGRGPRAGRRPRPHRAGLSLPEPLHRPRGPGQPARAVLRRARGQGHRRRLRRDHPGPRRGPLVRARRHARSRPPRGTRSEALREPGSPCCFSSARACPSRPECARPGP